MRTPLWPLIRLPALAALVAFLVTVTHRSHALAQALDAASVATGTPAPPGSDFLSLLWAQLAPALAVAVSGLALAGIRFAYVKLSALIDAKVQDANVRALLHRLNDGAFTVVKSTEGRVAAELRKAAADGKIDDAEKAKIREAALTDFKALLGPAGLNQLAAVLGLGGQAPAKPFDDAAIDAALAPRIEAALLDLKGAGVVGVASPASPPAPPSP